MKRKILVTGANGQLGKELRELSEIYNSLEFLFLSKTDLPIHHTQLIHHFFSSFQPDYCINCAAYTAVDRAESEEEIAFLVNAQAVRQLASICKEFNTSLFHISTDYVFNGESEKPYQEEDQTDPINVYGSSKLEGEKEAMNNCNTVMIIRTSWVFSSYGQNFVKTMFRLMSENKELKVVDDQFGCPTYAADLAKAILDIISSEKFSRGIFHYCNRGITSWYEFALAIKELIGSESIVLPINTSEYPTAARRPVWSVLNTDKVREQFHLQIPDWYGSLANCIVKLEGQK